MSGVRRSLGFAFLERYLLIALQLLSFVLLARLLTPQQVGLYSVSMALISMAQVVRDFGLANYLIQKKSLESADIGSALGVSLVLGIGLFLLVNLGAPWIGDFYNDDSLPSIVRIISLNFLILPFNSISIALLRRDMQFDRLMRINVSAAITGTATSLSLAFLGLGPWALAWGEIASSLTIASGALMYGALSRLVLPTLKRWRAIISFGGPVTLSNVVTSVSMDINDLVVGKLLGFSQVAVASRAQGLMNLFNRDIMGTIRGVAYPAFAKAHREDKSVETRFVQSVGAVTAIGWPFYGFVGFFPLEILRLMFGPQWDAAAPLVPVYCLAGAFSAMAGLVTTAMLATGQVRLVATADLIIQPVKALLLTAVAFYFKALLPLAIAFLLMAVVAVPYFYAFKQRCLPTDFAGLSTALSRNLLLAASCLLPSALLGQWLRPPDASLPLSTWLPLAGLTCLLWVSGLWVLKHPLFEELRAIVAARRQAHTGADT